MFSLVLFVLDRSNFRVLTAIEPRIRPSLAPPASLAAKNTLPDTLDGQSHLYGPSFGDPVEAEVGWRWGQGGTQW